MWLGLVAKTSRINAIKSSLTAHFGGVIGDDKECGKKENRKLFLDG
jgi:uncharacterized protein Veg